MYVDENQDQFCVDADKASGDYTFYMPIDSSIKVPDLMEYYFNSTLKEGGSPVLYA